ncbi:DUF305 domain-containing protein [Bradyrhizobium canariense]|uniref:DUF305 domain-containing protein n=1 Tax=Bradyrhizobium canariense TaxID=255045 RepID=A0A1H2BKB6_9BRAD|nr:DUF305 domain-containing protein [Bradyrhizobium canariense]SDT58671.1 protein of unknown function [Bradyrhizobium canariense]
MVLFSRSFIRKRVISFATTTSVAATSLALAHGPMRMRHNHETVPVHYVADRMDAPDKSSLPSDDGVAISQIMADATDKPAGDVDRDLVAMMVSHHQGAIDLAQAVLRYGHNEQLRRLAQEIVVTRQQEITAMRFAVGEEFPPSATPPTQRGAGSLAPVSNNIRAAPLVQAGAH